MSAVDVRLKVKLHVKVHVKRNFRICVRMHVTACLDNVKKVPGHARANVKMRGGHDLVGMHFYYGGNLVKKKYFAPVQLLW